MIALTASIARAAGAPTDDPAAEARKRAKEKHKEGWGTKQFPLLSLHRRGQTSR